MRKSRTRLGLLALENRLTPSASVAFQSGGLTVTGDNTSNTVALVGSAGAMKVYVVSGQNLFQAFSNNPAGTLAAITTPANNRGTYNLTGNINVTMGNSNDFVLFVTDAGKSIPGNVNVSLANGADNVIFNTNTNARATVAGSTTLNGGLGADNFFLDDTNFQGIMQVIGGGSGFRTDIVNGNPVTNPNDVFEMRDSTVFNLVSVSNAITFFGNVGGPGSGVMVQGNLIVSNTTANPLGTYLLNGNLTFPGYSGLLAMDSLSEVTGSVTYSGSTSTDGAFFMGTVDGSVTVVGSDGTNNFSLGLVSGNQAFAGTIHGSATFIGGSGVDSTATVDGSTVDGSLTLNTFDGANTYDLNHAFAVNGNFTIFAGNGDDAVGTVGGSIAGNQKYTLGNGNNSLTWSGTAGGGRFDFTSGGGTDALTINGINAFALNVNLGAGDDTFTYGVGARVGSAYIDFGAGTDTYNDNGNVVDWPQTLLNL